jgi:uncharacterized membrane protein YphA (DoxX/SURF4 family)
MSETSGSIPKPQLIVSWVLRVAVTGLYAMFATQKIPYAPESQAIFGEIGGHPSAIATALLELVAGALLLIPKTVHFGAALSMMAMVGAIGTHVAIIGIDVQFPTDVPGVNEGDGGSLFGMAVGSLIASAVVLFIHRGGVLALLGKGKAAPSTSASM